MKTIPIDNVRTVVYQDPLTEGHLSSIHVVFGKPGQILNYSGPGLKLALDLLRDQFPPQTEAERNLVERPVATPIDFTIDPITLKLSASVDGLKHLGYVQLLAAYKQAQDLGCFQSGGRSFDADGLQETIQAEIKHKKPQEGLSS